MSTYRYSCESFLRFLQMSSRRCSGTSIHPPRQSSQFLPSAYSPNMSTYSGTVPTLSFSLLLRFLLPRIKSHQLRIFRRCANSVNDTQTAPFSPAAKSVRHLTRCYPPNMTGEKGKVGSSCCATGTLSPGADCEMAVKFCLNRSTGEQAFVKCSHLDQVVLLRLQRNSQPY